MGRAWPKSPSPNSGHGIPEDKLTTIFNAFFTTKTNGTGLGLPIARTIVETHGGAIWARNRSGGGAAFHFTLPLTEARSDKALISGRACYGQWMLGELAGHGNRIKLHAPLQHRERTEPESERFVREFRFPFAPDTSTRRCGSMR